MNTRVQIDLAAASVPSAPARIATLKIRSTQFDKKEYKAHEVGDAKTVKLHTRGDALILAVSPGALGFLVTNGVPGRRIVDRLPSLSQVRRLSGEPIPVLNLFFKKKLPDIPRSTSCCVGRGRSDGPRSRANLARRSEDVPRKKGPDERCYVWRPRITTRSQRTTRESRSTLSLMKSASISASIAATSTFTTHYFDSNTSNELFLNSVGGKQWQPETQYPDAVLNLFSRAIAPLTRSEWPPSRARSSADCRPRAACGGRTRSGTRLRSK